MIRAIESSDPCGAGRTVDATTPPHELLPPCDGVVISVAGRPQGKPLSVAGGSEATATVTVYLLPVSLPLSASEAWES